jgi:hypothetical protein
MHEGPPRGAFMPSAVRHFYSGQPMHFYSGVDIANFAQNVPSLPNIPVFVECTPHVQPTTQPPPSSPETSLRNTRTARNEHNLRVLGRILSILGSTGGKGADAPHEASRRSR